MLWFTHKFNKNYTANARNEIAYPDIIPGNLTLFISIITHDTFNDQIIVSHKPFNRRTILESTFKLSKRWKSLKVSDQLTRQRESSRVPKWRLSRKLTRGFRAGDHGDRAAKTWKGRQRANERERDREGKKKGGNKEDKLRDEGKP